jgi:hypothetical protein
MCQKQTHAPQQTTCALQVQVTKMAAQSSGNAFTGAVDDTISEGFTEGRGHKFESCRARQISKTQTPRKHCGSTRREDIGRFVAYPAAMTYRDPTALRPSTLLLANVVDRLLGKGCLM